MNGNDQRRRNVSDSNLATAMPRVNTSCTFLYRLSEVDAELRVVCCFVKLLSRFIQTLRVDCACGTDGREHGMGCVR